MNDGHRCRPGEARIGNHHRVRIVFLTLVLISAPILPRAGWRFALVLAERSPHTHQSSRPAGVLSPTLSVCC